MISEKTYKLLIISKIPFVGKASLNTIANQISDWDLPLQDLASKYFGVIPRVTSTKISKEYISWADKMVSIAEEADDFIISQQDEAYPKLLSKTKDAPAFLYCRGNMELLNKPSIAIIGTREPSEDGKVICDRVTKWFTEKDWVIVSGLALGVDTIAHSSCIKNSGNTIVVYGNHLNKIYPAENVELVNEVLSTDGLLISEYPYDNKAHRSQFVERDRIQAGLSAGVVLVQSDLTGGSMHASKSILRYDRYLIVLNQSRKDINNRVNKIEANIFLLNESFEKIKANLGIKIVNDKKIIRLMHKDEYGKVNKLLLDCYQEVSSETKGDLFS